MSGNAPLAANPLAMARLSESRNQLDEAERLYLEAIRQSPNDPVAYHCLAIMYARHGKFEAADQCFSRHWA